MRHGSDNMAEWLRSSGLDGGDPAAGTEEVLGHLHVAAAHALKLGGDATSWACALYRGR